MMINQTDPRILSRFRIISNLAGIIIALCGLAVIIGWVLDISVLKSFHPKFVNMKVNTAINFIFIGISLCLLQERDSRKPDKLARRVANTCAALVLLIGFLTLFEYIFGLNLAIDQIWFKEHITTINTVGTPYPGRMSPNSAVNFILIGLAILFLDKQTKNGLWLTQFFIIIEGMISILAFIGYFYGSRVFYGPISMFKAMALPSAITFNLVFFALMFIRPNQGVMIVFTSNSLGGIMLRRLLFPAGFFLLISGWLKLIGERGGFYDSAFGASLLVGVSMIVFTIMIWLTSSLIHRLDTERQGREEKIRELNENLNQRNLELGILNKELEAFNFSVSHDLREPLRNINAFSQILLEEYNDKFDERGKNYLSYLQTACQRMRELIEALLDLSRITRTPLSIEKVNLSEITYNISERLKHAEPARKAEFIIAKGITAEGDKRMLTVALENLFNNAWKFTGKHACATIEFGVTEKDGQRVYFLRDDGAGFDMKYAYKLFNAFQRLHNTEEFPGTGIGLSIVQRIIHRHGGRIWTEAKIDKGATFYFTL